MTTSETKEGKSLISTPSGSADGGSKDGHSGSKENCNANQAALANNTSETSPNCTGKNSREKNADGVSDKQLEGANEDGHLLPGQTYLRRLNPTNPATQHGTESMSDMPISAPTPGAENFLPPRRYADDAEIIKKMADAQNKFKPLDPAGMKISPPIPGNENPLRPRQYENKDEAKQAILDANRAHDEARRREEPKKGPLKKAVDKVKSAFRQR